MVYKWGNLLFEASSNLIIIAYNNTMMSGACASETFCKNKLQLNTINCIYKLDSYIFLHIQIKYFIEKFKEQEKNQKFNLTDHWPK